MVLSVAKRVPAGLHVYHTLDGKINTEHSNSFCVYLGELDSPPLPPTYFFFNYIYLGGGSIYMHNACVCSWKHRSLGGQLTQVDSLLPPYGFQDGTQVIRL